MEHRCYYCGELKECQGIKGKNNELKAGYMSKEPVKVRYVCRECIKNQGSIAKIAESI